MENQIKLIKISVEQAINHSRREYNPYEWKRQILRFASYKNCQFFEYNGKVYSMYDVNNIPFMMEIEYMSSLDNGGMVRYKFCVGHTKNEIFVTKTEHGVYRKESFGKDSRFEFIQDAFFASVYFSI